MFALLFVLISSLITFARTITTSTLRNWDEAWYAEVIKNMASGQYGFFQPYWNGRIFLDNAPLYFWLSTPIVKIFGLGLWQIRFVSALAAIFACILIFLIGKKLAGTICGLISFIVFLTLGGLTIRFAHANLESLLVCFTLAAFYFYLLSEKNKFFSILSGATIGLGFLVKSWSVGLFGLVLIILYAFAKERKLPRNLPILLAFLTISCAWWYFAGTLKFGKVFFNWYILNPTENKFTSFTDFSLDYFIFTFRDIGFWLLVPASLILFKLKSIKKLNKKIILPLLSLPFAYIFFLNFLSDKSDWYLIPALTLIALLIGYLGSILYQEYPKQTAILIFVVLLVQMANVLRIENIYPDRSAVGKELGIKADRLIPKSDTIVLDDPDFTAFLYYSNHGNIFTLEDNQKSEALEWWKVSHKDLEEFTKNHSNTWVITRNPNNINLLSKPRTVETVNSYTFLKF